MLETTLARSHSAREAARKRRRVGEAVECMGGGGGSMGSSNSASLSRALGIRRSERERPFHIFATANSSSLLVFGGCYSPRRRRMVGEKEEREANSLTRLIISTYYEYKFSLGQTRMLEAGGAAWKE